MYWSNFVLIFSIFSLMNLFSNDRTLSDRGNSCRNPSLWIMSPNILWQTATLGPVVSTSCISSPRLWDIVVIGTTAVRRYSLNLFILTTSVSALTALIVVCKVHRKLSRMTSISPTGLRAILKGTQNICSIALIVKDKFQSLQLTTISGVQWETAHFSFKIKQIKVELNRLSSPKTK